MSNWKRYGTYCPPFDGTLDEEMNNFASHYFHPETVEWAGYTIDRDVCVRCSWGSKSEQAKYPCGEAPPEVLWHEYVKLMRDAGRGDELSR
jgi:hypothetical protein